MNSNASIRTVRPSNDKWIVPKELLEKLGAFDQDVYAPFNRPWDSANEHLTIIDNGLNAVWHGRVFCHPPDGTTSYPWLEKCAKHGNATALTYAKTDAKFFQDIILEHAHAILFIRGRLKFHYTNGKKADSSPLPSILVAFDHANAEMLKQSGINGRFIPLKF